MELTILASRRDAARALGISIRTLDNLIRQGEIRARRVGRRVLLEKTQLEAFSRRDHPIRGTNGLREGTTPVCGEQK
jgi:excisionase family DNA binding protein